MSATSVQPRGAHLVGSIPLQSPQTVFTTVSSELGDHVRRIPDGETGGRELNGGWIGWQLEVFRASPFVEVRPAGDKYSVPFLVHVRDGIDPDELHFEGLGYTQAAIQSYGIFSEMKSSGQIPEHVRFQVSLPSPLSPVMAFVAPESRPAIHAAYVPAMLGELAGILDAIPHDELAVQWDICQEVGVMENVWPEWWPDREAGVLERIKSLVDAVPEDVELGVHLCYGDYGHQHFKQPQDAGILTWLANNIAQTADRRLDFLHIPVPRDRDDEAYFAPLANLELAPETEFYLGLVHATDGVEGARRRIGAASSVVSQFGVSTECGLGRRPSDTVAPLLALHREVSSPLRS